MRWDGMEYPGRGRAGSDGGMDNDASLQFVCGSQCRASGALLFLSR